MFSDLKINLSGELASLTEWIYEACKAEIIRLCERDGLYVVASSFYHRDNPKVAVEHEEVWAVIDWFEGTGVGDFQPFNYKDGVWTV